MVTVTSTVKVSGTSEITLSFDTRAEALLAQTGSSKFIQIGEMRYAYDPSGTALTTGDGRTWSPAENVARLDMFDLAGDDSTDDTAAMQLVADWLAVSPDRKAVGVPGATYKITSAITTDGHFNLDLNGASWHQAANTRMIAADCGYQIYALSTDYTLEALTIPVADTGTALTPGTMVKIVSDAVDPGNRDEGSKTNQYRVAEWAVVAEGTTTTSIALERPLRFVRGISPTSTAGDEARIPAYTTSLNARVIVPNQKRFRVKGKFYFTGGQEATWTAAGIRTIWYPAPIFDEVEFTRGYGAAIMPQGSTGAIIRNCHIANLENNTGNSQYGYGVADSGYYTKVLNTTFVSCRHGYTTNNQNGPSNTTVSGDLASMGRVVGARIEFCTGLGFEAGASPFDTHMDGEDISFVHCHAEGCAERGFTVRGRNILLDSPVVRNCGQGIYAYTEYDSGDPDDDLFTAGKSSGDFTWARIVNADIQCNLNPFDFAAARVDIEGTIRVQCTSHRMLSGNGIITVNASGRLTCTNFDQADGFTAESGVGVFDLDDVNANATGAISASELRFGSGCDIYVSAANATGTGISLVNCASGSSVAKEGCVRFSLPAGSAALAGTLSNIEWGDGDVSVEDFGANDPGVTDMGSVIQEAHDYVAARGGGNLVFESERYLCGQTLVLPKDGNVHWIGVGPAKYAPDSADPTRASTELRLTASVTSFIQWNGAASVSAYTDLAKSFSIRNMVINGSSLCTNLIECNNSDSLLIEDCRLIGAPNIIESAFTGTYSSLQLPGGLRLIHNNIGPTSGVAVNIDAFTQCWIEGNWFSGNADTIGFVKIARGNKINVTNNEFNGGASTQYIFQVSDAAGQACSDLILNDNKINVGNATADIIDDLRTEASSRRLSFVGCNIISGAAFDPASLNQRDSNVLLYTQGDENFSWIGSSTANAMTIRGAAGTTREVKLMTDALDRWRVRASSGAEGGANAGSDMELLRFDDAGGYLASAMTVKRSNGALKFSDGTGTESAGSVTINAVHGLVTTSSLTTGAGAITQIQVNNDCVTVNSRVFAQVRSYSGAGVPIISKVQASSGFATITIYNTGSSALNNTATIQFWVTGY